MLCIWKVMGPNLSILWFSSVPQAKIRPQPATSFHILSDSLFVIYLWLLTVLLTLHIINKSIKNIHVNITWY